MDVAAGSFLGYLKVPYQALPNLLLRNDADVEWQVRFADQLVAEEVSEPEDVFGSA